MKLLVNFLQSQSGGARSYLRSMLRYINQWPNQEDLTVYVLIYQRQLDADQIDIAQFNIKTIIVDSIPQFKPVAEQWLVRKAIHQNGIDVLFTPYQVAVPFKGVKSISMLRNMEPFFHKQFPSTLRNRIRNVVLQFLSSYTLKKSDLAIAVSDFSKQFMINNLGITESKIVRIYHGRDLRFSPVSSTKDTPLLREVNVDSKTYIFTNGSILPYRKLEIILEAFALSLASNDHKLVIAGDSNDANYKSLIDDVINRYRLEDKVIRLGFIDIEKIMVFYRHCKLFITATEIEACPNIAIEAMSSGCPVVASDKAPLPEMFQDKAIYFNAGDVKNLADKLDAFISTSTPIDSIDYNIDRFSWQQCANETLSSIKSVF